MNGILTGPSLSLESSLTRKPSEPKWRNWQTQRTQNPPFSDGLVGSTPTFGTTTSLDAIHWQSCPDLIAIAFSDGLVGSTPTFGNPRIDSCDRPPGSESRQPRYLDSDPESVVVR